MRQFLQIQNSDFYDDPDKNDEVEEKKFWQQRKTEAKNWGLVAIITLIVFGLYRIVNDVDIMEPPYHALEIVLILIDFVIILLGIYYYD